MNQTEVATYNQIIIQGYGAAKGWPAAITAACNAFEASFGLQDSAKGQSVAKNAELKALVAEMNAFKSCSPHARGGVAAFRGRGGGSRHHVKNNAANKPGAQAAWDTAAHVEKP